MTLHGVAPRLGKAGLYGGGMDHGGITFSHVRKEFPDGTVAVGDLSLDVTPGEIMCLVGPSGCGKSTTLRMVNRLIEPTAGTITVDNQDVMAAQAVELRRSIGYVIQHVGLFPHKTVAQNVATVPQLVKWPKDRIAARVNELLDLVGLDADTHGPRYPHELSGGQRQRVGVARALAVEPPVMLMDEPFGAVDPQGRRRLQSEFMELQRQLGLTVMMVTHDMREAVLMADRIAVLSTGGVLEQLDTPERIVDEPANDFVADFLADFGGLARN
ncbi:ABC transporter ATP-binding protein [Demequina flava]|uniref:ABC transporter ATP-binding protein n=1 Tax=Demequina flava TaxID=1095025 RepID=UPI0034E20861